MLQAKILIGDLLLQNEDFFTTIRSMHKTLSSECTNTDLATFNKFDFLYHLLNNPDYFKAVLKLLEIPLSFDREEEVLFVNTQSFLSTMSVDEFVKDNLNNITGMDIPNSDVHLFIDKIIDLNDLISLIDKLESLPKCSYNIIKVSAILDSNYYDARASLRAMGIEYNKLFDVNFLYMLSNITEKYGVLIP